MPTGGAAIMRQGPNLLKLARKGQCRPCSRSLGPSSRLTGATTASFPTVRSSTPPQGWRVPEKVKRGASRATAMTGGSARTLSRQVHGIPGPFDLTRVRTTDEDCQSHQGA